MKEIKSILVWFIFFNCLTVFPGKSQNNKVILDVPELPYIFELNTGESHLIQIPIQGKIIQKKVKLISVAEFQETNFWFSSPLKPHNFFQFIVKLKIGNHPVTLYHRPYQMPVLTDGLQIFIENISQMDESALYGKSGDLEKEVRISIRPADEYWASPDLIFPINDYIWRSAVYNNTWSSLVPFNQLYYHRGEDYGAIPDRLEVVAPCNGVITKSPLPDGDGASNAICILDERGIEWRLSHMNIESIRKDCIPGTKVKAGSILAKTGMTWSGKKSQYNDPHLHIDLSYKGTKLASFPFLMEMYQRKYNDPVIAVAGGYRFASVGEKVYLDGGRSLSRNSLPVKKHTWILSNGKIVKKTKTWIVYDKPGIFSEELIVETKGKFQDRDFLYVKVYDEKRSKQFPYGWAYYFPVKGIKAGKEVLFWNRLTQNQSDAEINFGDNMEWYPIKKETCHHYEKPGRYVVTLKSVGTIKDPVTLKMEVVVENN